MTAAGALSQMQFISDGETHTPKSAPVRYMQVIAPGVTHGAPAKPPQPGRSPVQKFPPTLNWQI
jgi:hypothetical protein